MSSDKTLVCICGPAEVELSRLQPNSVDFVFSGPPFLDKERYGADENDSEGQVWKNYGGDFESYLCYYLFPCSDEISRCLQEGGMFAINIDNVDGHDVCGRFLAHMDEKSDMELIGTYGLATGRGDTYQPIYVFKKVSSPPLSNPNLFEDEYLPIDSHRCDPHSVIETEGLDLTELGMASGSSVVSGVVLSRVKIALERVPGTILEVPWDVDGEDEKMVYRGEVVNTVVKNGVECSCVLYSDRTCWEHDFDTDGFKFKVIEPPIYKMSMLLQTEGGYEGVAHSTG